MSDNQHLGSIPLTVGIGIPLAIGGVVLLFGSVLASVGHPAEIAIANPLLLSGVALIVIGLLLSIVPHVSGRRVVDFLGWLLLNVSAYLILWLLHCVSTNLDASDLRYIGNGQSVWPIEVVPWIVIFMTILNLLTLGIAILSRKS